MNKRNVYSTLIYKEFMILKRQTLLLIFSVAVPILVIGTSWLLAFGSLEDNKDPNIIKNTFIKVVYYERIISISSNDGIKRY